MQVAVIHTAFENAPQTVAFVDVGEMETNEALEYAFRWTNNVMGSWSIKKTELETQDGQLIENGDYNRNVTVMVERPDGMGLRSTSMGDQMLIGNTKYNVDMMGFSEIEG